MCTAAAVVGVRMPAYAWLNRVLQYLTYQEASTIGRVLLLHHEYAKMGNMDRRAGNWLTTRIWVLVLYWVYIRELPHHFFPG